MLLTLGIFVSHSFVIYPHNIWNIYSRSQEEANRIDQLSEEVSTLQNMQSAFNLILTTITVVLNVLVIFMRTNALKALWQIVISNLLVLFLVFILFTLLELIAVANYIY